MARYKEVIRAAFKADPWGALMEHIRNGGDRRSAARRGGGGEEDERRARGKKGKQRAAAADDGMEDDGDDDGGGERRPKKGRARAGGERGYVAGNWRSGKVRSRYVQIRDVNVARRPDASGSSALRCSRHRLLFALLRVSC